MLRERNIGGINDFLSNSILRRYAVRGGRAIDLGAGSGALAVRLRAYGFEVLAADIDQEGFEADVPFLKVNFNMPDFISGLQESSYDFVSAVEVIEHLESPIGFLRNISRLLNPNGIAVITTPNMDNAPARFRFILTGKLHMMDEQVPNHISPIFYDLFVRQYLPRAGLKLIEHYLYPHNNYKVTRKRYAWALRTLARLLPGDTLLGDVHVFVLRATVV